MSYETELSASASVLNSAMNSMAQSNINKKTQKWNEMMYGRQRQDALTDWQRQNEYNSPSGQMARLREAGLNPNLVYGNGADAQSGPIRSTEVKSWNPQAPQVDFSGVGNSLMLQYDIKMKEAQTNNLEVQNTVLAQDLLLKLAQTEATHASSGKAIADTALTEFNTQQAKALQNVTLEKAQAELGKTRADTDYTLSQNERAAATTVQSLQKGLEEILNLRAQRAKTADERAQIQQQTRNLVQDSRIKQLDINLKANGIQPGDPIWARVLSQLAAGVSIDKIKADIKAAPGEYKKTFQGKGKPYKFQVPGF